MTDPDDDAGPELPSPVGDIPSVRDALREKLDGHRAAMQAFTDEGKPPPVLDLMGGPLGVVETVLPVAIFSAVYGVSNDLRLSLISAIVPSVLVAIWRLLRREPITTALSGLVAVGIGAWIAARTGNASDFFWPSVIKNAAYALVYAVSAIVGWPLIGVMLGYLLGEGTEWRNVPQRRRAYSLATWLWFGMFGVRVVIQTPLLLAGQTVLLGAVNIFLGLPLFFLTIWATWMVVRRVPVARPAASPEGEDKDNHGDQNDGELDAAGPKPATQPPSDPAPVEEAVVKD